MDNIYEITVSKEIVVKILTVIERTDEFVIAFNSMLGKGCNSFITIPIKNAKNDFIFFSKKVIDNNTSIFYMNEEPKEYDLTILNNLKNQ